VFRNFLTLGIGEAVARGLHAIAILLLARLLKPEAFGTLELAVAIAAYAALVVEQGFDTIAIREVARQHNVARNWLWSVLRLRLSLMLPVLTGLAIFAYSQRGNALGLVSLVFSIWCINAAITPRWVFLALGKPRTPALATILAQLVFLAVTVILVRSPSDAKWAAAGWVGGESLAVLCLWLNLPALPARAPEPLLSPWRLVRASWSLSVTSLMGYIMFNFDALALAAMGRRGEIGLYLAAYRCLTVFWPILIQFQDTLLAHIVRLRTSGTELLDHAKTVGLWSLAVAVSISTVLSVIAPWFLTLLFGPEYESATIFLRILIWALPLQVIRLIVRQILVTRHQQTADTRNAALAAATNVLLDLVLIPMRGALGCAIATLSAGVVIMVASLRSLSSSKAPN
jgi:O-antigen/teichoic acid export membrane protein